MSVGLFVPGSAIWWGSYSIYKEQYWRLLGVAGEQGSQSFGKGGQGDKGGGAPSGGWRLIGIQAVSAVSAGCTTSLVTTPLDVIKTRFQVANRKVSEAVGGAAAEAVERPSAYKEVTQLFQKEGLWGFYRGLFPRMTASSLWGTSMILAYEFLKRNCIIPDQ